MSSNWRPLLALAAAIALGWFGAMQSTSSGQNPARLVPTRWEYDVRVGNTFDASAANTLGGNGWELVTVYRQSDSEVRAIYKRRS